MVIKYEHLSTIGSPIKNKYVIKIKAFLWANIHLRLTFIKLKFEIVGACSNYVSE